MSKKMGWPPMKGNKQMATPNMPTKNQANKHQFNKLDHRRMHAKSDGDNGMGMMHGQKMLRGHMKSGHNQSSATAHNRSSMRKHKMSLSNYC